MLTLQDRPTFTVPVVVNTVALQGTLTASFFAIRVSELRALENECNKAGTGQAGLLKKVTAAISDVNFPALKLPMSPEVGGTLDALLDWPGVSAGMNHAYYKALFEEREKNSPPPPSGS